MIGRLAAPLRQVAGYLRTRARCDPNRQMAKPQRQMESGPIGLRIAPWLLGTYVRRLAPLIPRPKSRQSTSIDGILSANGGWREYQRLERKRRGVVWGPKGGNGHAESKE